MIAPRPNDNVQLVLSMIPQVRESKNGFCTQIGNAQFAWFGTTGSKSRLNFLELLRAGHGDYIINDEALA